MPDYVLSVRAERDVEEIYRFSIERFGRRKVREYVWEMRRRFAVIADEPLLGRPLDGVRPGVRHYAYESHDIYYRARGGRIEVVRVLHRRMNLWRAL